jgi:hypothetical protein
MKHPGETVQPSNRAIRGRLKHGAALGVLALALVACAEPVAPRGEAPSRPAAAAASVNTATDDYVATPAGLYHKSCVREIPAGAVVDRAEVVHLRDGSRHQVPPCAFAARASIRPGNRPSTVAPSRPGVASPTINGWVEYTWATSSGSPYKRILADWTVPAAPAGSYGASGKVYYTFPGLQSNTYIIQPVLQYGNNGGFGGAYWTIASWQCGSSSSNCFHSTPITVSSGNAIHGDVTASGCVGGSCTWTITTTNSSTAQSTTYQAVDTENYWQATSGAVEVYQASTCSDFPANTNYNSSGVFYTNVAVYGNTFNLVSPGWSGIITSGLTPQCNYRVTSSSTTANLYHAPNFTASISGLSSQTLHQSSQYTATAVYGASPLGYQWRIRQSPDGFSYGAWSSWYSTGSQNYTFTSVNSCGLRRTDLQVQVTDALGRTATSDFYIDVSNPC